VLGELRAMPEVYGIYEFIPPKLSNDRARILIGLDSGNPPKLKSYSRSVFRCIAIQNRHVQFFGSESCATWTTIGNMPVRGSICYSSVRLGNG
jgi:hypothetical protein